VEEAFDIIEEVSIADFTADAVEDAVADVDLDVASDAAQDAGSETVAPLDTGIQTDNLVADPGRIDNGSGEDRGNIIDGTSGDEAINPVKPDGGGCAAAGSGNLSGALFMLLAFVAIIFIRRKVYA
jgi:MYXO-CTERM domain-containing protein